MQLQIVASIEGPHPSTESMVGNIACRHHTRIPPRRGAGMAIIVLEDSRDTADAAHSHHLRDQRTKHIENLPTTLEGNGRRSQK